MKDLLQKYNALSTKSKVVLVVVFLLAGLFVLPNTLVYAAATFAAFKLIGAKIWRYIAVSLLASITFFSGILWIAGDTVPTEEDSVPIEQTTQIEENDVTIAEGSTEEPQNAIPTQATVQEEIVDATDKAPREPISAPTAPQTAPTQSSSAAAAPTTPEPAPAMQAASAAGGEWYTSSHFSAKYYYHASCDGWQGLSKSYLKSYSTEAALKAAHPAHVIHPECSPR